MQLTPGDAHDEALVAQVHPPGMDQSRAERALQPGGHWRRHGGTRGRGRRGRARRQGRAGRTESAGGRLPQLRLRAQQGPLAQRPGRRRDGECRGVWFSRQRAGRLRLCRRDRARAIAPCRHQPSRLGRAAARTGRRRVLWRCAVYQRHDAGPGRTHARVQPRGHRHGHASPRAADRRPGRTRLPDQRDHLLAERIAAPLDRAGGRAGRLRAGPGVSPAGQRSAPGQQHTPAARQRRSGRSRTRSPAPGARRRTSASRLAGHFGK